MENRKTRTLKDEKILAENDTTISEENEVAEIFWSYFDGVIVNGLNIKQCEISKWHNDPIVNAIKTFEKDPSIL